jgi:hypothetical protein
MSGRNELDLDAILAEFHAEERQAQAKPAPAPVERPRRRAEIHAAENVLPPEPAPIPRQEPAAAPTAVAVAERPPVRQEARPVVRETRPVQRETRPEVREARPVQRETRPEVRETRPEARDGRAARRRQTGIKRMLLALAALAVLLTGLLIWTIHDEKQAVAEDPEIISLDLGEALEEYLDQAPTRMRG